MIINKIDKKIVLKIYENGNDLLDYSTKHSYFLSI